MADLTDKERVTLAYVRRFVDAQSREVVPPTDPYASLIAKGLIRKRANGSAEVTTAGDAELARLGITTESR